MEPLSANDPRKIGEFALRARLGAGGMGRVYLASSPAGRAVAIKVVHPELAQDPEFRQRFSREVAAARAVSGMYTAPVVASGLDDDPPWLATAFVPGPSLAAVVSKHGPLPEPAVWRLAAGLAEALRAVHACGLIHRDLKPANVLLAADGPHVIDFGISRAFEGTALTSAGMVVGTPGYMSPEQAEGALAGPESDVFSLGCVLAYAATGTAPFGTGSAAAILYRVVTAAPDLTGIPGRLRQVIEYCLKKNPAERTGLTQLSSAISALGPAAPVALGSFWPDQVAGIIAADQAYPTAQASQAQASPARQDQAQPGSAQAGQAPALAPLSAATGGYQPTATALGGAQADAQAAGSGGAPGTGSGTAGHAGMVPDGYLSAANRAMGARQPSWTPQAAASGWPQAGSTPAPATQQAQAPWAAPSPATPQPQAAPSTPWPQAAPSTWPQQPGTPNSWPPGGTPAPLAQYTPGRRHPTRADTPPAVLAAIRLMYAGAAASLLEVILGAVAKSHLDHYAATYLAGRAGVRAAHAAHAAHAAADYLGHIAVFGGTVGILCWILLAMACRRGRGWVSIAGTALLGLHVIGLLLILSKTTGYPGVKVASLLVWGIGLATIILLWGQQARQFFAAWRGR